MRFACLVYVDPTTAFDGSPDNIALLEAAEAQRQQLLGSGVAAEALGLPSEAVTIRIRKKRMSRTDGPFMETKEVLAGFVLIDAENLEAAVEMAATNPMAQLGAVEVRPLVDFSQPRPVL
ncbi:MAG: YciI family protein [Devosia sp.]